MSKEKDISTKDKKEDDDMAAIAKPSINLPVIDISKSKEFIKKSNKKKLSQSFLRTCKQSSSIFKKDF